MTLRNSLMLAAAIAFAGSGTALAQNGPTEDMRPHVVVLGEGEASAAPDLAVTSLTVLRTAATAADAVSQANEAAAAVTAAMRELGVEGRDLQTGGLSVTPQYRYENRPDGTTVPPEIVGYEVRNTLTVRVRDLNRLGEILDRAIEAGVNQGGDFSFQIEDSEDLRNEARREAVEQARASAETLADAAGTTLGPVLSIVDEPVEFSPPRPYAMQARLAGASADSGVPVEIGENTITARVRVSFALETAAESQPQ